MSEPIQRPVSPATAQARQRWRDLLIGRETRKIKESIENFRSQGYTDFDAVAIMIDLQRDEINGPDLVRRAAGEMGIEPLPPGYRLTSKLPPLPPWKKPAKTESVKGPIRTDSNRKEKRVDFLQQKQNGRVRPPVPSPSPPPAQPPRLVEARLEALHLAPQKPEPSKAGPETTEQQRALLEESRRQRYLAKKADRKRGWELGGRYGHPIFPRGGPHPSKGEEQRITAWEKRMQQHAERAMRYRKGLELTDEDNRRAPHFERGGNDRRRESLSGRGNERDDEPVHSPQRDPSPPLPPHPPVFNPPGPPGPPPGSSSSSPSPPASAPPLPPPASSSSSSSSSSSNRTIHSLVPHIFPNLNRPEITGLPMEVLLGIVEYMRPSSRIRLALGIPRVFQSPSFINLFTLDAARQMRNFRASEPPHRWHGGEPEGNIPLLQTAIYRTYCDADVISRILDGYAAVAGDVLNDIYMFRGFRPPLVAATYALRPDLLRVLFERGADPNIRWPFLFPSRGPTDMERLHRCTSFLESHRECQPPPGLSTTSRRFVPCPDLYTHALHVYDRRRAAVINPRGAAERAERRRVRDQMNRAEETVSIVVFQLGLHRFDHITTNAIPHEINRLIDRGLYRIVGDLADAMIRATEDNHPSRRNALNLLLERVALSGDISEEEYDVGNIIQGSMDESIRLENMDRRDNLLRRLVALGARIAAEDTPEVAQGNGRSMLVILRAIARINPDENNETFRFLVDARQINYEQEFATQLIQMIKGRRDDLARFLYAAIRDGDQRLYNELIDTYSAGACRQALFMAIRANNINLLDRLMRLPYNGNILGNGTPNNGHALPVYPIIKDAYDPMDHIVIQGRNILEGALIMRNFDAALFLVNNGFPTTIDNDVMERVQRGLDELRGNIAPMTGAALEEAGEPPLDSGRILPIYNGRPQDEEAQRRFRAIVTTFETVASQLKPASENGIDNFDSLSMDDKSNGLNIHMAIVGAGPRGTSVLERMCASAPYILAPDVQLTIHVIDPFPPGAGSIWRTDQPTQLIMNTVASQMTMYTDESVTCSGPIRPGQDFYTWQMNATGVPKLGPNDCATRAGYGQYLRWVFDQIQLHAPDKNRLCYIPPAKPAEIDLSPIKPNQAVLVRGLGLSFFDYIALLTEARGGRFESTTTGLQYIPSGKEPRIYAGSRRGIPYISRGDNKRPPLESHTPYILTEAVVNIFRSRAEAGNPPDFYEEIWPLLSKEVETVYYETMLGANNPDRLNFQAEFLDTEPGSAEEAGVLDKFNIPTADRWSWEFMARPYDEYTFTSAEAWQNWLLDHLNEDVRQAALGNIESPHKAAINVLRDLRNVLRRMIEHGGISDTSRRHQFDSQFSPLNAYLAIGPPRTRIEQLIALIKAGVVTILGPELEVQPEKGAWLAISPEIPGSEARVTGIIEARVPESRLRQTADELLRDLLDKGQCRVHTIGGHETGGLDVTPSPYHLVNNSGVPHPRRFAVGVPTEGVHWLTAIGARPGINSVLLLDTDAVARAALMASVPKI